MTGGRNGRLGRRLRISAPSPWWTFAAVALAAACAGEGQSGTETSLEVFARIVNVEVETVAPRSFTQEVRLTGVARAMNDVVVSAEEGGVVRAVVRDKGRSIGAGDAIVRLDDAILKAQVATATAQARLADEVWERRRKLYEEDGIGSELSYLEARYAAEQARGSLDALEERLARTTVRAPIGGTLDDRFVEVGAMVSPGTPVARIVQTGSIKVLAGVPERYALDVAAGARATVRFSVLPGERFPTSVSYAGATIDPQSRTFAVELKLPNPGGRIKPEMIADIEIVREEVEEAIVVSQQALVSMEEGYVVFVVEGTGDSARAAPRRVEISVTQGNDVVVASGLEAGDRLVVVGQQGLTGGDRVRVVDGRMEPETGDNP